MRHSNTHFLENGVNVHLGVILGADEGVQAVSDFVGQAVVEARPDVFVFQVRVHARKG